MDDRTLCWACQADISEEVQEQFMGANFCEACAKQLVDYACAIRQAALNAQGRV